MRLVVILFSLAVVVGACTSTATTTSETQGTALSTTSTSTSTSTPTSSTTTTVLVSAATTTTVVTTDSLTAVEIDDEQLVLMTLDLSALGDDYDGFEEVAVGVETNLSLAQRTLQDPSDEANDIATLGRTSGARAELRPRAVRVGASDLVTLHSWVNLFESDEGAAAYLEDFVQDAAKGIGGGIPDDLAVTSAEEFALDPIGSQTAGLILTQDAGDGFVRYQTVVGLRVGRVLGFVAVVHPDDGDRRVRAVRLAEALAERIEGVLTGVVEPPPPPQVLEPLVAYAFSYVQTVEQGSSESDLTATGVDVVGEGLECRVVVDLGGLETDRRYVVSGLEAQVLDANDTPPEWNQTSVDAVNTASDLIYCPGWPVELVASGLDVALAGKPVTETVVDGADGLSYILGDAEAAAIGFFPPGSDIEVQRFVVVVDAVNPWVRSLALDLTGPTAAFVDAYGPEFGDVDGDTVTITIRFAATRINDPALDVAAP